MKDKEVYDKDNKTYQYFTERFIVNLFMNLLSHNTIF